MRGRILSWILPRSSVTPRLQSCCSFGNSAETSVRTLNSSGYQSTNSRFPHFPGSSHHSRLDKNSGTSNGTLSSFLPIRCLKSSSLLRKSSPSRFDVEAQRRSFAATGNTKKGLNEICWACEHEILSGNGLLCPSCDAIQPLDLSVNHFTIFGIKRGFQVDTKVLEQKYKNLQKKLHPDLMSSKSQVTGLVRPESSVEVLLTLILDLWSRKGSERKKEQGFSADQSAHVIQAYYTLLRPLSRARYLLGLAGIRLDEEGTVDDPALLMEIMEIRESLEYVSDAKELQKLRGQNDSRIQDTENALETTFATGDLKQAVSWVQRLAYYIKVDEEIVQKL